MRFRTIAIIVLVFTVLGGCKEVMHSDRIKEGYIEYDIEYLDNSVDNFMKGLLPKKMIIKFKNNNTLNKIEGFSGIVSFTHIQNFKEKKNITLVKVLNKKYKYIEKINDKSMFFEELPEMVIEPMDSTSVICNFKSEMAKVTPFPGAEPFNVFYTNDITISNVNAQTPYKSLDGVLLDFELKIYGMPMRLKARKVQETEVSLDDFEIPVDYDRINKKTMMEIIDLLKQ